MPPSPPPRRSRSRRPARARSRTRQPLILRVTCDAACDVFAQIAGREAVTASASLPAAGSRRLVLAPIDGPIAPRGGGKVRVLLRSSAPGAHRVTARTLTLDLRRARINFPPRVLGLTVTPDGDDLVVRWRTAKPARPRSYSALAFDDEGRAGRLGHSEGERAADELRGAHPRRARRLERSRSTRSPRTRTRPAGRPSRCRASPWLAQPPRAPSEQRRERRTARQTTSEAIRMPSAMAKPIWRAPSSAWSMSVPNELARTRPAAAMAGATAGPRSATAWRGDAPASISSRSRAVMRML